MAKRKDSSETVIVITILTANLIRWEQEAARLLFFVFPAICRKVEIVHTYHAGASELIAPLFDENGKCRELIALGIFRKKESGCVCPEGRSLFPLLPLYDEKKMVSAAKLLFSIFVLLGDCREKMFFEHFPESIQD